MVAQFHSDPVLFVHSFSTGFIDVPSKISMNVFVSGCAKRCLNCHNPELHEFKPRNAFDTDRFKDEISKFPLSTWVCFLGGDAVYQASGLESLSKAAKECGKNVCLYTGLIYEELDFLNKDSIDLIIDGEYDENRGALHSKDTNQRIFMRFGDSGWQSVNYSDLRDILSLKF